MPNAGPDQGEPPGEQQEVERWLVEEGLVVPVKGVLAQQTMLDVDGNPVVDRLIPLPGGRDAQMPQSQPGTGGEDSGKCQCRQECQPPLPPPLPGRHTGP